jgi:hypothetical protein
MEPTVLEQLRLCFRAKKLQPAEIIGTLSENYHGYAQVRCELLPKLLMVGFAAGSEPFTVQASQSYPCAW